MTADEGNRVRIAIVTETWRPYVDGVVTRLSATVSMLRREGHQVLVIAPDAGMPDGVESSFEGAQVRGINTFRVPFIYGGRPWGYPLPRVGRYLDEFRPDVVHVANPVMLGMAGVLAARRRRLPLVASYHTDVAQYAAHYYLGFLSGTIHRVTRGLHNAASINLATSPTACSQLRRLGVGNVHLWRRGVDLELFRPERRAAASRDRFGARPGQAIALYVGRLSSEKGLHHLESLARDPSTMLVLVGDGPARDRLSRRWSGLDVCLPGTLRGSDLADAYAAADVFVFPSTTETLGLVLLEAMATGLPIIAADSPTSRDLLQTHPHARVFSPDRAKTLPETVSELAAAGGSAEDAAATRRVVEGWSWPAATRQLLGFYQAAQRDAHAEQAGNAQGRRTG